MTGRRWRILLWLGVGWLLFIQPSAAEIYKWVDAEGKVHFSDAKPDNKRAESVELKINSYHGVDPEPAASSLTKPAKRKRVVLYSTDWCSYCKQARRYFRAKGIAFKEYDIEKSASAKKAYDKLGGHGVPLILVGSARMSGFSEARFNKLYEQ